MDRLEQLGNALSNVTMYDIKSAYNQAKNMVLNVSEMEAKVREATNDDPWGASSTLMQEIAAGTHNFQQFNEIMPCIYSRFMDKEARQWREIYKALQLLEYIIKHGSERVVDDARSHLSTIKMLRNFHYIDEKGKDQGINVRNRAKELTTLLMDVDMIRAERRKAKANRNKYVGTGNDATAFGGGRYGGFGSDSFGSGRGYGGGSYDSGYGGYGGGSSSGGGFRDDRRDFDEYNAGDDEIPAPRRSNSVTASGAAGGSRASTSTSANKQTTATKQQEKVVDLLGFDDEDYSNQPATAPPTIASPPAGTATLSSAAGKAPEKALPSNPLDDGDDDFADFQTAPASAPVSPAPTNKTGNNVSAALAQAQTPSAPQQRPIQPVGGFGPANTIGGVGRPASVTGGSTAAPLSPLSASANRTGFGVMSPPLQPSSGILSPISPTGVGAGARSGVQPTSSFSSIKNSGSGSGSGFGRAASAGFDDLWNMSLGSSKTTNTQPAGGTKSMKDLEKEKSQASIWGAGGGKSNANANSMGHGFGTGSVSGTFGLSGNGTTGGGSSGSGGDDLLL